MRVNTLWTSKKISDGCVGMFWKAGGDGANGERTNDAAN